jgi:cysteinyl-tRNA synthetase
MDDDLNTPAAVAVIHDAAREGNAALDAGDDQLAARTGAGVRAMLDQLGLDPLDPHWDEPGDAKLTGAVDALVKIALEQRAEARARKDYAAADRIRDELAHAGITVKDTPRGPVWTVD